MIVNKVHLENWGIIREPTEVEFSDGLNILHGPNDIGKTTLIDSIRTVFFTKHNSHSEKVRSLIPWGSTLSPKATIIFFQNGDHYRITKRFISSEMSLLEKLVDDKWERIAEGDSADKRVIELVGGKLPVRGDTKSEFWGIGQALWMVQGKPFISEDLNEETLSSLQKLIGAAIESDQEKEIFRSVNREFSEIFTGVRRDTKKGSDIKNLEEKIGELEEDKGSADSIRIEKENLIREIDDKEIFLQKKKEKLKISLAEREKLKEMVTSANEHRRNREKLEEEIKRISSEYKMLKEQIGSIKEGKKKIKDIEAENYSLDGEEKGCLDILQKLQEKIDKLVEDAKKIDEDIELNDDALRCARIAYDTIQKERELNEKEQLLGEVEELESELSKKQKNAERLKSPLKEEVKQIEQLHQRIHDIRTKLDAIGLTTKIAASSNISGKIHLDEKGAEFKLKAREKDTWTSYQTVKIQIDKIGSFEIKSGSEDIREMGANLEKLEIDYEKAVAPYAVKNIEKLRELSHQKEELEKEIKGLKKEVKKRAKNGKETIEREIAGLKKEIESNWDRIPENLELRKYKQYDNKNIAQQELSKKIDELEKKVKNLKKEQKDFDEIHSNLGKEKERIKVKIQAMEKKVHGNLGRIEEIRTNLGKLQEDGLIIKEREKRLNEKSSGLDKKERAWEEYKNEIKEVEEKPLRTWEECETSIEKFQEDMGELKEQIAQMNGKLSTLLTNRKNTNKIEEELEYLKKRKQQLLTDARAIGLLYDLMHFYRGRTIENLTTPIQKMMTEDLRNLFGEKYIGVKFDEGIKPIAVEVPTWRVDAPIDILSFGTKEQMWYLFRLALGVLLSSEEKQLVVLDDPLANTDPSRMHRALQILKDKSNKLQIIVITCDVDKYNWLPNASFKSLEK
jgi:DNA repair exonuclease SbcCD ATPase subunit